MLKSSARPVIRLRGVRHNNLKNFDLDLPLNQLIVVTGLSGSGKSSLAFDTLFAEGQRRYIETFSPYARQFFDRMDKPQVDSIEGIPPAIAIEQRNSVRTTRSTVGTMTEICDYLKVLWPHVAQLYCRQCGRPVRKDSPQAIWESFQTAAPKTDGPTVQEVLLTFDLPLTEKLSLGESLALVAKQGYQRLLANGQIVRTDELAAGARPAPAPLTRLTVVQDRLKLASANRARFVEACEQAYHFGKGKLTVWECGPSASVQNGHPFSSHLHCAHCDIEYREPSPALFSFNHPLGACPSCRGFGRIISIDYNRALPDRSKTLAQGVVKPWQSGQGAECQTDLLRTCRQFEIPTNVPFERLPKKWQDFVVDGQPDYGKDEEHEWPRAWYGVKGYFRWLESRAYKMHVRVLLSRYRAYTMCPACQGQRFQPDALLYRAQELTLADFYRLPIRDALGFIERLGGAQQLRQNQPVTLALDEVKSRLSYLQRAGLGYLTLDRPTRSLSGGETERVSLTTCLGTRLVNTLFVLDEPSVGLHPCDTERLVRLLEDLRSAGNTVVVVEHEASVMRAADQIVDLGPGHGATGGQVVFQGPYAQILQSGSSLTGQYLSGRKRVDIPQRRPVASGTTPHQARPKALPRRETGASLELNEAIASYTCNRKHEAAACLTLSHASLHNLRDLSVEIPLNRFVCVTGVSGSGKTTLIRELLWPALAAQLETDVPPTKPSDRLNGPDNGADDDHGGPDRMPGSAVLEGANYLHRVILVDQSILGKTPRSNPAVYIGAFDDIREFYAESELARQRGLGPSAFSFNSTQGQCERCRGAGFEKIEMQFLSDVFIRCPDCSGRRYRPHILEIKVGPTSEAAPIKPGSRLRPRAQRVFSIADLLESTIEEAVAFLEGFPESRPAGHAVERLKLLQEVGLGYLKLGQPINTLSGGECQRLKLVRHLAESLAPEAVSCTKSNRCNSAAPTLFLFDEPTTGLHFDDVRVLLRVFQRLVDSGHSVLVIEHNMDIVKCADWIIDLGPGAGDEGGRIVAQGAPEQVAAVPESQTGQVLREALDLPSSAAPALSGTPGSRDSMPRRQGASAVRADIGSVASSGHRLARRECPEAARRPSD